MEDNERLKKEMDLVIKDLRNTKNITYTSKNTNIHHSKIYNWISNGKNFQVEPFYSFYLEYEEIMGNSTMKPKKTKNLNRQKKEDSVSLINEKLEKLSLDDFDKNTLYEFDKNLSQSENILRKLLLKEKGKNLEDENRYDEAINYYKSILKNSYFSNDYYVYRRLSMLYERKHQWNNQLNIIKQFFKSNIYASEYQIRWMVHKLFRFEESGSIDKNELDELILYYDEHGSKKKDLENYPVILAERIFKRNDGTIGIKSQFKYEKQQRKYELKEIGAELERTEEYDAALGFYWELVEKNINGSTDFYKRLVAIYEKLGQYENELNVLSLFYKKKYKIVGRKTKNEFEKRLKNVNLYLGTNYMINDLSREDFNLDNKNQDYDELLKYVDLYEKGLLTKEEFEIIKKDIFSKLINENSQNSLNNKSTEKKFVKKSSEVNLITIGSNNFSTLLKSDIGDEIIAQEVNRSYNSIKLKIIDIQNKKKVENFTRNVIKINEENFNFINNLNPGELITIKCKGRHGKVTLKLANDEKFTENDDEIKSFKKPLKKDSIKYDNKSVDESVKSPSKSTVKYIFNIPLPDKYKLNFDNPFGFDSTLSDEDNIKMKFVLKDNGNNLTIKKLYDDAIDFYEYLKKNSYFENDWYPYRQLTMIYEKIGKHEENIENIRQLFYSGIYCNGYQYIWFVHKLNNSLEHVEINESEIGLWLDYYKENGANNENKLDTPIFIADRIVKRDDRIRVYSKEIFYNNYQKLNEFQEKVRFSEKVGDYESALEAIKSYYREYFSKVSHNKTMWFRRKLKLVNKELGTNYDYRDFI